jgi:protein gp37
MATWGPFAGGERVSKRSENTANKFRCNSILNDLASDRLIVQVRECGAHTVSWTAHIVFDMK